MYFSRSKKLFQQICTFYFSQLLAIYYLKYILWCINIVFVAKALNTITFASSMLSLSSVFPRPRAYFHMKGYEYFRYIPIYVNSTMYLKIPYFVFSWYDECCLYFYLEIYCQIYHMGMKLQNKYLLLYFWLIGQYQKKIACVFIHSHLKY